MEKDFTFNPDHPTRRGVLKSLSALVACVVAGVRPSRAKAAVTAVPTVNNDPWPPLAFGTYFEVCTYDRGHFCHQVIRSERMTTKEIPEIGSTFIRPDLRLIKKTGVRSTKDRGVWNVTMVYRYDRPRAV